MWNKRTRREKKADYSVRLVELSSGSIEIPQFPVLLQIRKRLEPGTRYSFFFSRKSTREDYVTIADCS